MSSSKMALRFSMGVCALSTIVGCKIEVTEGEPVKFINPNYFQVVSLSERPDDTHSTALTGPRGRTWYREAQPCIDLGDLDLEHVRVIEDPEGGLMIALQVKPKRAAHLRRWSRDRVGGTVGIVLDEELVVVSTGEEPLGGALAIRGFKTERVAQFYVDGFKKGGITDAFFERVQFAEDKPDVPAVFIHRFAGPYGSDDGRNEGPVVAVWSSGRIVRVTAEDQVGKSYVEGDLDPQRLAKLRKLIEKTHKLTRGNGGVAPVDATIEMFSLRRKDGVAVYAESRGSEGNPILDKVRRYLLHVELSNSHPTARPWLVPPREWHR